MDTPHSHPLPPPPIDQDGDPGPQAQVAWPAPWKRLLARMIDWAIHGIIVLVVLVILASTSIGEEWSEAGLVAVFAVITASLRGIYETVFIRAAGATLGKLAVRVRVQRQSDGSPLVTWSQSAARAALIDAPTIAGGAFLVMLAVPDLDDTVISLAVIAWGAAWLLWLVEVLSIFGDSARRGVHDRMCKTVVVSA